jgi:hypothetical protein
MRAIIRVAFLVFAILSALASSALAGGGGLPTPPCLPGTDC